MVKFLVVKSIINKSMAVFYLLSLPSEECVLMVTEHEKRELQGSMRCFCGPCLQVVSSFNSCIPVTQACHMHPNSREAGGVHWYLRSKPDSLRDLILSLEPPLTVKIGLIWTITQGCNLQCFAEIAACPITAQVFPCLPWCAFASHHNRFHQGARVWTIHLPGLGSTTHCIIHA